MSGEIWVIPFFGQGHLFPCMELAKQIASRNHKTTFIIPSNLSPSIPSSFRQFPLVEITEIPSPSSSEPHHPPPPGPPHEHHSDLAQGLEILLSSRKENSAMPLCCVMDIMMGWIVDAVKKFEVPIAAFFTSGACSAAMEHAMWKAKLSGDDVKPGEIRLIPGLPEEMGITYLDLKERPHQPPHDMGGPGGAPGGPGFLPPPPHRGGPGGAPGGPGFLPPPPQQGGPGGGPPRLGGQPPWMEETKDASALLFNTCDDLERPFIEYLTNHLGKPVWGVGPQLPEQFWKSAGSVLHDRDVRANRRSNVTEDEVIQWLDSKPRGSVLSVAFGSEVGPTAEELPILANALEESNKPFIWAIQARAGRPGPPSGLPDRDNDQGYVPEGLAERVGERGLIIQGWAPQLLILSHPSTAAFLTHCGWNSTTEAIVRGVPLLGWPIRGDQPHNAKLIVRHLKVGYNIFEDPSQAVKKEDIVKGIESLMGDEEVKRRAAMLSGKLSGGFPASSKASLDAFCDFISQMNNKLV